jgi:hypothetical protein
LISPKELQILNTVMNIDELILKLQTLKEDGITEVIFQDYNWNLLDVFEISQVNDTTAAIVVEVNIEGLE